MAEGQKRSVIDAESVEEDRPSTKRRKPRNGVTQLSELRPGTAYQLVAQYGSPKDPTFIMQLILDGKVFQGIGPSKTKAKVMAAEFALIDLGAISSLTENPPLLSNQPYCWEDFSADIFDSNSSTYFDFDHQNATADRNCETEISAVPAKEEAVENEATSESRLIGKNTLTILMDRHPGSSYKLVASQVDNVRTKFVMDCYVNGEVFRGAGMSKRLAKARAAKQALQKFDNMVFGTAEDGMPFYEGDEKIWLKYKAELEKEAESKLQNEIGDNPVQQLSEYFPDAKFNFPDSFEKPDITNFFICSILIDGTTYEGSGTSKKDAKNDAAAAALNDLEKKGVLKLRELEMEYKKLEREEKKKAKDGTERKPTMYKSAVAKLNDNFQNMEYKFLSETPLKNTRITAFTVAVSVRGKNYVGVGKNKRMAKIDAAEKVLKNLGMWTEQDEQAKERLKTDEDDLDIVESDQNQRGWNSGQDQRDWGSGWGQTMNWNAGNNQYMGYDGNCSGTWYGGGYYGSGGDGAWGVTGGSQGGNFEAFQPMMKEIMGSMFQNAFGSNPWKPDGGGGFFDAAANGAKTSGGNVKTSRASRWDMGVNSPNKSSGNFTGSTGNSAVFASTANSATSLNNQPGVNSKLVALATGYSKENSDSGRFSKYSNFRSAGFDTGFTPSFTGQSTTSSATQSHASQQSNYGPYGTLVGSSAGGNQGMNYPHSSSAFTTDGTGKGFNTTGNHTGSFTNRGPATDSFQSSGNFTTHSSASPQVLPTSSALYTYENSQNRGTSAGYGSTSTGTYSDYGNGRYQGYSTTSGNPSDSFSVDVAGKTSKYPQNYASSNSEFQYSGTGSNYSGTVGNSAVKTTVPTTVYQASQVSYSANFQATGTANSSGGAGYTSGNFQGNVVGDNYMTSGGSGYYGMYNSGYSQGQGYDYSYDSSGGYNMNSGYNMGGYQNSGTNSGYGYDYPASNTGQNSYYADANRTSW